MTATADRTPVRATRPAGVPRLYAAHAAAPACLGEI